MATRLIHSVYCNGKGGYARVAFAVPWVAMFELCIAAERRPKTNMRGGKGNSRLAFDGMATRRISERQSLHGNRGLPRYRGDRNPSYNPACIARRCVAAPS